MVRLRDLPREIFVSAELTQVRTIDPGEIRAITLTVPKEVDIVGARYPIRDEIRPGNAFLAKPWGARTRKLRRRMYSRSNCAATTPLVLETIINHTHEAKADTSIWWQTEEVEILHREGSTIDIRLALSSEGDRAVLFENSARCGPTNLRLEPDGEWDQMLILALVFSTGITPFLSIVRYMAARRFGRTDSQPGARLTLVASARTPRQLLEHEELLGLARQFPDNFTYHPVLTREWPAGWVYGKGRIIRAAGAGEENEPVDLGPLREVVPDLERWHVRLCGNAVARSQLERGLRQSQVTCLSFRAETW